MNKTEAHQRKLTAGETIWVIGLFFLFLIKCAAAFMGIVSDKRVTNCTDHMGNAGMLLFRTAGTAMLLFLITLALLAIGSRGR